MSLPEDVSQLGLGGDLRLHVGYVSCLMWCKESASAALVALQTELPAAIESAKDPKNSIPNALTVFPAGRCIIADADEFLSQVNLTLEVVGKIVDLLLETEKILDHGTFWKATLAIADAEILAAEKQLILRQRSVDLLSPKLDHTCSVFVDRCSEHFCTVVGPLLEGQCEWSDWVSDPSRQCLAEFFSGLLSCQCIGRDPWCLQVQPKIGAARQLQSYVDALVMVHQHGIQDEPEALLTQCATLRGFVERGLGLNDVVSNLIGEKMAEALKTFEREKFRPMAKVVQSKVNSACVQVAMVLMSLSALLGPLRPIWHHHSCCEGRGGRGLGICLFCFSRAHSFLRTYFRSSEVDAM